MNIQSRPPTPVPPNASDDRAAPWHARPVDAVLAGLEGSRSGLSVAAATDRLARYGPNSMELAASRSAWLVLLDQFRSVIVLLLLAAVAIALFTGDLVDAIAIGAVLVLNALLGFVTEIRARRAMEALLKLQAPIASVVRDGAVRDIPAADVVPGDIIALDAGQFVPADARVTETADLRTNEAALTGESAPVSKSPRPVDEMRALADRTSMVYQGTTVSAGTARAVVVATGMHTELGRIGALMGGVREERTPLEERLDALGKRLVWVALAVAVLVAAIAAVRGLPLARMLETGIALAVAAVPESLPAVVTIALAVGVRRMARRKALIRRLPSAETLGAVTVICSDKTGTLTAGQMTLTVLALPDREIAVGGVGYAADGELRQDDATIDVRNDAAVRALLTAGVLANHADLTTDGHGEPAVHGDPTEVALLVAGRKAGLDRARLLATARMEGEVPFSSDRMFMATFHRVDGGTVAHVKGAPRVIIERCARLRIGAHERALDQPGRQRLLEQNRALAARGLRVLAMASGDVDGRDEAALTGLTFLGLAGMLDPPAAGVRETIGVFDAAGIRTVMITGDQKLTARSVAAELGILGPDDEVLDGSELQQLDRAGLMTRLAHVRAFSRVSPESKLAIVDALQERGDIVAMLGDGVNDAPALRKADVGVAMGRRGTDVAKEAAAVVLQDDRFATIGAAIEQGRVIFDNVRKFVFYLFSCNLAEVLVLLVAAASGLPLPLLPLQILWLNLLTDTLPALSLAVEPAERDVMRRPPRDPEEAIFSRPFFRAVTGYAGMIAAVTLVAFLIGLREDRTSSTLGGTMSFLTLALAQGFHLVNARLRSGVRSLYDAISNRGALAALVLVILLQTLAVEWGPLTRVLETQPLSWRHWVTCAALATIPAIAGQLRQLARRFRWAGSSPSEP